MLPTRKTPMTAAAKLVRVAVRFSPVSELKFLQRYYSVVFFFEKKIVLRITGVRDLFAIGDRPGAGSGEGGWEGRIRQTTRRAHHRLLFLCFVSIWHGGKKWRSLPTPTHRANRRGGYKYIISPHIARATSSDKR